MFFHGVNIESCADIVTQSTKLRVARDLNASGLDFAYIEPRLFTPPICRCVAPNLVEVASGLRTQSATTLPCLDLLCDR